MRWPWRRPPPALEPELEHNGTVDELKDYAQKAVRRAKADRGRVERVAPRIANLPEEEFMARVAELFRARYP